MVIRKTLPLDGSSDVPVNSKITISLVGGGDEEHMEFFIRQHTLNIDIPFTQTSACYLHESHTQNHCTITLYPHENLLEHTDYSIVMHGTDVHQEDGFAYMTDFSTGDEHIELEVQEPQLDIMEYIARAPDALDSCDWPDTMKYDLHIDIPDRDTTKNIIIQVYDVDVESCTKTLVHTLFPAPNMSRFDFRQVLEPDDGDDHCYMVVREDWARNTTRRSSIRCWDSTRQNDEDNNQCMTPLQTIHLQETANESQAEYDTNTYPLRSEKTSKLNNNGCSGGMGLLFLPIFFPYRRRHAMQQ